MKKIIFNKNDYSSYKDFYHDICVKLDKNRFIDWKDNYEDLCYSADALNEFLWYCHNDNLDISFLNFDLDKIKQKKTYDNYEYSLAFEIYKRWSEKYTNNKITFINEE